MGLSEPKPWSHVHVLTLSGKGCLRECCPTLLWKRGEKGGKTVSGSQLAPHQTLFPVTQPTCDWSPTPDAPCGYRCISPVPDFTIINCGFFPCHQLFSSPIKSTCQKVRWVTDHKAVFRWGCLPQEVPTRKGGLQMVNDTRGFVSDLFFRFPRLCIVLHSLQ